MANSGTVMLVPEPGGVIAVLCFVNDPATQLPMCDDPFISEHRDVKEARAEALLHREEHWAELAREGLRECPTCGRKPGDD